MEISLLLDQSTSVVEDDWDNNSLFEFVGDQEDGTTSTLCHHCQRIVDNWSKHWETPGFKFPHHQDTYQLEQAATDGCTLCYQFWRNGSRNVEVARYKMHELRYGGYEAPGVTIMRAIRSRPKNVPGNLVLELHLTYLSPPDSDSDRERDIDDCFDLESDREIIDFVVTMIPAITSGSKRAIHPSDSNTIGSTKRSLELVAHWLEKCRKAHWKCNASVGQFIPTRLVTTEQDASRVCLSADIKAPVEYATLSHCWGKMKFLTLTKSTLEIFQSRIPQTALSQTFRDATEIARQLGISYLWIDSLCIVQDDPDDWRREAALMSAVYGGAVLNIAASGADNGSVGCFFERPHDWRCHVQVKVGDQTQHYDCVSGNLNYVCLSTMPLMFRGWTIQERLLAPRTLHFTTTEVFWECHHKTACESFPEGLPLACRAGSSFLAKQPLSESMWGWIVEKYSLCKLTYVKDKLAAISGLARYIQQQNKDQYVAGMWRSKLVFQLCWFEQPSTERVQTGSYVAPTWSWASAASAVDLTIAERFKESEENTFIWIKILSVWIQTAGTDPFGPLSGASLRLSCTSLLHVGLRTGSGSEDHMVIGDIVIECYVCLDGQSLYGEEKVWTAYALPVFGSSSSSGITGLLLERTNRKRGQYRRAGFFRFYEKALSECFELALAKWPRRVDTEGCFQIRNDKFGNTQYIIDLI